MKLLLLFALAYAAPALLLLLAALPNPWLYLVPLAVAAVGAAVNAVMPHRTP